MSVQFDAFLIERYVGFKLIEFDNVQNSAMREITMKKNANRDDVVEKELNDF